MLVANLHLSLSYAFFKANQGAIATEQCVMRSVDDNNCQGSCVLRNLLEPVKQKEESQFPTFELKIDEFLSFEIFRVTAKYFRIIKAPLRLFCDSIVAQSFIFKIWRPPQL